jgi:hypothetical protein
MHFEIRERDSDVDKSKVGTAIKKRGFHFAPDNVASNQETFSDDPLPRSPEASDTRVTPTAERQDPTYHPAETRRSRREMQTTRFEPPITRSRAREIALNYGNVNIGLEMLKYHDILNPPYDRN